MAFWDRWFKKEKTSFKSMQPNQSDKELVKNWIQNIIDSISSLNKSIEEGIFDYQKIFELIDNYVLMNNYKKDYGCNYYCKNPVFYTTKFH